VTIEEKEAVNDRLSIIAAMLDEVVRVLVGEQIKVKTDDSFCHCAIVFYNT